MMSEFTAEIQSLLNQLEADIRTGSAELVRYAAQRRQHIAAAVAGDSPDIAGIVRTELLNIKAYAATEAVRRADRIDAGILAGILAAFSAFDTMLLASLD